MATVSIKLRTDKSADSDGKYPLAIRVYHKKTFYFFFPFRIAEEEWNEVAKRVNAKHHNNSLLNSIIQDKFSIVDDTVIIQTSKNRNISADRLKAMIEQKFDDGGNDFIAYYENYCEGLLPEFSQSYYEVHKTALNHFKKFFKGTLHFDDLTVQSLRKIKAYLLKNIDSPNTVSRYLKQANTAYKQAVKDGVIPHGKNPFEVIDYPSEKVHKTHLTSEEMKEVEDLEFEPWTLRWKTQKAFLFSFWTAGMRFSDVCLLKWSNVSGLSGDSPTLNYVMLKNGKEVTMPLVPPAVEILKDVKPDVANIGMKNDRIFKFVSNSFSSEKERHRALKTANSSVNRSLREVFSKRISFDKNITFHISRHSFSAKFEDLDLPVQFLQSLLGHSSSETTEDYRKNFSTKQNKKSMGKFFEQFQRAASDNN